MSIARHVRTLPLALIALLTCAGERRAALAAESRPAPAPAAEPGPKQVETAVARGLSFLETRQLPDGAWPEAPGKAGMETTTWVLLSFLANGHTPRYGPYRITVERGLAWLSSQPLRAGGRGLDPPDLRRLFVLLSAVGMGTEDVRSEDLVIWCESGVDKVKAMQHQREGAGGDDAQLDVRAGSFGPFETTYWATLCLVSARQAGMPVSRIPLDELSAFWLRGFPQSESVARSVIALALLGRGKEEKVRAAAKALPDDPGRQTGPQTLWEWYLAKNLPGGATHLKQQGSKAQLIRAVLARQAEHGSFRGGAGAQDEVMTTAEAVFALGVPKNYLPGLSASGESGPEPMNHLGLDRQSAHPDNPTGTSSPRLPVTGSAAELRVGPGMEYGTISAALADAGTGDRIAVEPGTYEENLVWPAVQGIALYARQGPYKTTVKGDGRRPVIAMQGPLKWDTVIDGFTLTGGGAGDEPGHFGAGLNIVDASPTVRNCRIVGNQAPPNRGTGGVFLLRSRAVIEHNEVRKNRYSAETLHAGGIAVWEGSPRILSNVIAENVGDDPRSPTRGAGLRLRGSRSVVMGNRIERNVAVAAGSAMFFAQGDRSLVYGNEIAENVSTSLEAAALGVDETSSPRIGGEAKGQPNGIHANKRVVRHKDETSEQLVTLDAAWLGRSREIFGPNDWGADLEGVKKSWEELPFAPPRFEGEVRVESAGLSGKPR